MRGKLHDLLEKGRVRDGLLATRTGDPHGMFAVASPVTGRLFCLSSGGDASSAAEWAASGFPLPFFEHVSVSVGPYAGVPRCPTWGEMAFVKSLFWGPAECVLQYHPPEAEYVNAHPTCLHLWRPVGVEFPRPPAAALGPVTGPAAPQGGAA